MEIVVFGAGSLGSLIGGLLAEAHEVTLVGRPAHMAAIEESGLTIAGAVETEIRPQTTTEGEGLTADLALVTVKAGDTAAAAEALSTGSFGAVCSLQNGLTEETLAAGLSVPVLAGTATYGARLVEPGHVDCTGRGTVTLGTYTDHPTAAEYAGAVGEAFSEAGIETVVVDDMERRRWAKLAINAAINPVTALARVENGAIGTEPLWGVARAAACETAAVARADGVSLSDETVVSELTRVCESTAANRSSMLQDVDAGRSTEIEAITGTVVKQATHHDVDVPTNRLLLKLVAGLRAETPKKET
jgi:2-dehydropantoate 2-reductase